MTRLFSAIGCAFHCALLFACVVILVAVIGVPVVAFWRAEGALSALGVLALLLGIGWNARPFKKETGQ